MHGPAFPCCPQRLGLACGKRNMVLQPGGTPGSMDNSSDGSQQHIGFRVTTPFPQPVGGTPFSGGSSSPFGGGSAAFSSQSSAAGVSPFAGAPPPQPAPGGLFAGPGGMQQAGLPQQQHFPPLGAAGPHGYPPRDGYDHPEQRSGRRKSTRRPPGAPRRTYAICSKCGAWKWHDIMEAKCTNLKCGKRWPQAEQERKRQYLEAVAEFEARGAHGHDAHGRPRSRPPAGAWPPQASCNLSAGAAASPPDAVTAIRIVRELSEAGQLRDGDGDTVQLPADLIVDRPAPAAAPPAALSLKQIKHTAEQEYQRATKAQRGAFDAVRAAESLADEAETRFMARQQALVDARVALQACSQTADAALQRFNDASKAFQEEVAAAGATTAAKEKDGKASDKGSRASSRASSHGTKRPGGPEESDAVTRAWATLQAKFRAALAAGDEEAIVAASESSCRELIELQKAEKQRATAEAEQASTAMGDGQNDGIFGFGGAPGPGADAADGGPRGKVAKADGAKDETRAASPAAAASVAATDAAAAAASALGAASGGGGPPQS